MNDPYGQQAVATGVTDGPALRKAAELRAMKPVVYFTGVPHFWMWDSKNEVAGLDRVINHPNLGTIDDVRTSTVLNKFRDGSFETRNTVYKPYVVTTTENQ
jgi:hypothetical protein